MISLILGIVLIVFGIVFISVAEVLLLMWYKKFSDEWENSYDLSEL